MRRFRIVVFSCLMAQVVPVFADASATNSVDTSAQPVNQDAKPHKRASRTAPIGNDAAYLSANARCHVYKWRQDDIIPVEAGLYKHSYIQLPEEALDIVAAEDGGRKDALWDVSWIKSNIVVKPLSSDPLAAETTITAIGYSGRTYNFLIKRKTRPTTFCYRLTPDGGLLHPTLWKKYDQEIQQSISATNASQTAQIQSLLDSRSKAVADAELQGREALKKYRKSINTGYKITDAKGYFAEKNLINNVYDDGRFTFLKMKSDRRGLMSIFGDIDGKKELLEFDYDSATKVYQVSGVFPKLILRTGESEIVIVQNEE